VIHSHFTPCRRADKIDNDASQGRGSTSSHLSFRAKSCHLDPPFNPRIQILTVEGLLNGIERVDAPPQLNPFAMAAREFAREKQTEML
jgi:hypothetical protein